VAEQGAKQSQQVESLSCSITLRQNLQTKSSPLPQPTRNKATQPFITPLTQLQQSLALARRQMVFVSAFFLGERKRGK